MEARRISRGKEEKRRKKKEKIGKVDNATTIMDVMCKKKTILNIAVKIVVAQHF